MKKMTRRDFLRASAFAGGALLLPKRAWASSSDNLVPFTSDIALELSESLGDCFAPGAGIEPECATRVVDLSGSHRGWAVDFCGTGGEPYGYAVFDAEVDGLLLQATITEGKGGLVDSIRGAANGAAKSHSLIEDTVLMASPLQFGLVDQTSDVVVFNSFNSVPVSDLPLSVSSQAVDPIQWKTIMIYEDEVRQGKYQISDSNMFYDYNYAPESEIESNTGRYACAVSALYSIAGCLYTASGPLVECWSDWGEYQKIWDYTSTYTDHVSNGITYGATPNANIGPGFQKYCSARGFDIGYSYSSARPAYVRFKKQIAEQKHSIFTGVIVRALSDGSSELSGHAMAVYGWADIKMGDFPMSNLYVFNGWEDMVFLNYSYTGFQSATSTFFDK